MYNNDSFFYFSIGERVSIHTSTSTPPPPTPLPVYHCYLRATTDTNNPVAKDPLTDVSTRNTKVPKEYYRLTFTS